MAEDKKKRQYTRMTPELREEAFRMYCNGKTVAEIRETLKIGDVQGVAKMRRDDNWDVRKQLFDVQMKVSTSLAVAEDNSLDLVDGYNDIVARRNETATTSRLLAQKCAEYLNAGEWNPRSPKEAYELMKDAYEFETKLVSMTLEEGFIIQVFHVLQEEVEDQKLLQRIGDRLKLLIIKDET